MTIKKHLFSIHILILALIFIPFVTYINILGNALFFDDEELIYKNAYVQNLSYFPRYFTTNMIAGAGKISNMYRPILVTSFAVDFAFWKLNPVGYHLTSIILHVSNVLLIFLLFVLLFKNRFLAFFTALCFAVHPAISEAVIYASGRTDELFSFFALLSLVSFLSFLRNKTYRIPFFLATIVLFSLSLMSKETAIVIPFIHASLFLFEKKKTGFSATRTGIVFVSLFGISFLYFILRLTALNFQNTLNFYNVQNIYTSSLLVRFFTFTHAFFQYLLVLLFPKDLIVARHTPIITSVFSPWVLGFIALIVIVFTFAWWKKNNRVFFFSIVWGIITILPSSGIIPINNIAAEHYLYFPSIGFFLIMSLCVISLFSFAKSNLAKNAGVFILASLVLLFCTRTIIRTFDWRDPITFYTVSLKQSPGNIPMRQNLAMSYAENGNSSKAIQEYKNTIALSDTYPNTHHNLANTYRTLKQYKEAEEEYFAALKIDPDFYFSYYGLLELYKETGKLDKVDSIRYTLKQRKLPIQ